MKIQYIAVIFVIIILPIAIVMSSYIGTQIDTITMQTEYDTKLTDATYDAIKAFQINTVNNRYSSVSDSKIRDIEASVNTFYNSLSNNEYLSKEELKVFVPALVYTLYDGYYIYTKYDNMYPQKNGKIYTNANEAIANYGLKPYIYYSCRYRSKDLTKDFVVNYTLDNAITIYGTFNGTYKTLSGYLINPNCVIVEQKDEENPMNWKLTYDIHVKHNDKDTITIGPELLTEHLLFANGEENDYNYLTYNGQKIYYEKETELYFTYQNYMKQYITSSKLNKEILDYLKQRTYNSRLYSTSAFEYYYNAQKFSKEVISLTSGISQQNAIDEKGNPIQFKSDTGDSEIFITNKDNNDPLMSDSVFNTNRIQVIRKSIESNLVAAIANYNVYTSNSYEFSLPVLKETDWDKITNNVSVISFLQGLPIGYKYYNNYCVLTNNNNEEFVKKENIYIVTKNNTNNEMEYHLAGCKHLLGNNSTNNIIAAYSNISFLRQTVRRSENNYLWFYPQNIGDKGITACYNCIVNATDVYTIDEFIKVKIIDSKGKINSTRFNQTRELYIKALARERYDLYQYNMNSMNKIIEENVNDNKMIIVGQTNRMWKYDSQKLIAKNNSDEVISNVKWHSSNTNIIEVNDDGEVTAKDIGEAYIIAQHNDYDTAQYYIKVVKDKVEIYPTELSMHVGEKEILTYEVITKDATNQQLTWTSSNTNVATVDNGTITANGIGETTITATTQSGEEATCKVYVKYQIIFDPNNITIVKGTTYKLTPIINPNNLKNEDLTWTSSDSTIATVSDNGTIQANKEGTARILAKVKDGAEAEFYVTIKNKYEIIFNPNNVKIMKGETCKLTPTINPNNLKNEDLIWTSNDSTIATVSNDGTVTAKRSGEAIITATAPNGDESKATCTIQVKQYLADTVKPGDYINYIGNGYDNWRVMGTSGSGKTGKIIIIATTVPENIIFNYPTKDEYINKLQNICNKYLNKEYALSVRNVGTTSEGGNNSNYNTELTNLQKAELKNIGANYWVGYYSTTKNGCQDDVNLHYVNDQGENSKYVLGNDCSGTNDSCGIRPIITLKPAIIDTDGDGTQEHPYTIKIETE